MNTHRKSIGPVFGLKSLAGTDGEGVFEAIVSVFGNVDLGGDRIAAGAFADSLKKWTDSGDPIPVIFSHQWDNLDAHIGSVLEAKEMFPGDSGLPPEISANGGLWVKFRLDVDEDFAGRVAKRLEQRRIREFSFAYDVVTARRASDGANDLIRLNVIEIGPCLKAMNPATVLMSKAFDTIDLDVIEKAAAAGEAAFGDSVIASIRDLDDPALLAGVSKTISHTFVPSNEDTARCSLCGLTRNTVGHLNFLADDPGPTKTVDVVFDGSVEQMQEAILAAGAEWASSGDVGNGGYYLTHLEATFTDRAVFTIEGWSDPIDEGITIEAAFTFDAATGVATLVDPHEVNVLGTTVPKSRKIKRSASDPDRRGTVSSEPKAGKAEDKNDPSFEDPTSRTSSDETDDGGDPALVEIDLIEADIL